MKKLLVLSDSHGHKSTLKKILRANDNADKIVFLGDGLKDIEECLEDVFGMTEKEICMVKGNCDSGTIRSALQKFGFGGQTFLCLHGHYQDVKTGLDGLVYAAEENTCKTVLFGHTHIPILTEIKAIQLFNPGAVADGRYGVVQIDEKNGDMTFNHYII